MAEEASTETEQRQDTMPLSKAKSLNLVLGGGGGGGDENKYKNNQENRIKERKSGTSSAIGQFLFRKKWSKSSTRVNFEDNSSSFSKIFYSSRSLNKVFFIYFLVKAGIIICSPLSEI